MRQQYLEIISFSVIEECQTFLQLPLVLQRFLLVLKVSLQVLGQYLVNNVLMVCHVIQHLFVQRLQISHSKDLRILVSWNVRTDRTTLEVVK